MTHDTAPVTASARPSRVRAMVPLLIDVVAPLAVYYLLHSEFGMSDVGALTVGGLVGGVGVGAEALRHRRLDRLGLLVLLMFALTLALVAVTGDPRFVLAKPALFTAAAGLYCLATVTFGRPLLYDTAKPFAVGDDPDRAVAWDTAWQREPRIRRTLRGATVVWGLALLTESVARVVLTYRLPLHTAVWAVQIPGVAAVALAIVITVPPMRRMRTLVRAHHPAGVTRCG